MTDNTRDYNSRPHFFKMKRDFSKPFNQDVADNINSYWRLNVARVGNDNVIHTNEHFAYGVPAIANDPSASYKHDDIVWVRWEGKKLKLTRR